MQTLFPPVVIHKISNQNRYKRWNAPLGHSTYSYFRVTPLVGAAFIRGVIAWVVGFILPFLSVHSVLFCKNSAAILMRLELTQGDRLFIIHSE